MIVRELLTSLGFKIDNSSLKKYDKMLEGTKKQAENLTNLAGMLRGVAAGLTIKAIADISDEMTNAYTRVAMVNKGIEQQEKAWESVYQIALETRQDLGATANTYAKIGRSAAELGITQEEALRTTELVNKGFIISGASASEASASILQFGQALASGRFQGDELRSILENAPRLAQAIAKGLGVTVGQLRKMGAEGKLTAEKVVRALLSQGETMDKEFKEFPVTIAQAFTYGETKFAKFISDINRQTGVAKNVAGFFVKAFDALDGGVRKLATSLGGMRQAISLLTTALTVLGFRMAILGIPKMLRLLGLAIPAIASFARALRLAVSMFGLLKGIIIAARIALLPLLAKFAIFAVVVLVLEDIYYWLTKGKSALGEWLGPIDDVIKKFKELFTIDIEGRLKKITESLQLTVQPDNYGTDTAGAKASALGYAGNKTNNNNINVTNNIAVPAGTTAQQATFLGDTANKTSQLSWQQIEKDLAVNGG